jgi:N6-adenosine-specific RNA methylase IME4
MTNWPFGLLQRHHYGVIYADPPWAYQTWGRGEVVPQRDSIEQHYPVMNVEQMAKLPVANLARLNCALLMWSTSSHTPQAFWLAEQWGFRFASKAFTWAKLNKRWAEHDDDGPGNSKLWFMGMGHGTRRNTEDCWLFTRGQPKRLDKGVRELIVSPIREHSRKPDEAYHRIERLFAGPYCELFSRTNRPGWDAWGNDQGKFDHEFQ